MKKSGRSLFRFRFGSNKRPAWLSPFFGLRVTEPVADIAKTDTQQKLVVCTKSDKFVSVPSQRASIATTKKNMFTMLTLRGKLRMTSNGKGLCSHSEVALPLQKKK